MTQLMMYHCCDVVLWLAWRQSDSIDDLTSCIIVVMLCCGWQCGCVIQLT